MESGWYFQLPEEWWGNVSIEAEETVAGENQVTLYVDNTAVLALYTITNENRENRAAMGSRFVLWRQPGTIYAAELYDDAAAYGMNAQRVKDDFHMLVSTWLPSNS